MKDEVYVLPMPITLNNLKNHQTVTAKTEQLGTRLNITSKYAGHQTEHILNFHTAYEKKSLSCPLQQQVFNFCVAITFLPISDVKMIMNGK